MGNTMKKLLVGSAMSLAMVAGASAADLYVKAPSPAWSWTGFYIGGYVGDAASQSVLTPDPMLQPSSGCAPFCGFAGTLPAQYSLGSSIIAGGTAGYNLQVGMTVFGLESEFGYIHMSGSAPFTTFTSGAPVGNPSGIANETAFATLGNSYATFTARAGFTGNYLFNSPTLIYAKVGAAVTRFNTGVSTFNTPPSTNDLINAAATDTIWGAAAGAGVEWALGKHWSLKGEYEYLGFHHTTQACSDETSAGGVPFPGSLNCTSTSVNGIHTGKFGINYRF
jgi:outer membrane immunogenic protein